MTDVEIFHHKTKPCGGRLNRDNLPERPRMAYAEIAERAEDLISSARRFLPRLPHIHFDFVHSGEINAIAFRSNDRYFMGLNTGTVFMVRLVIGRMLSDSRLFGTVGNPKDESDDPKPLADYCPNADAMYEKAMLATPKNNVRQAYAHFLQDQAIMFFVGHEIAHITRGHVDYLRTKRGMGFTTELGWFGKRSREKMIERQCLEQDADRRSIISRIDSLGVTYKNPNYPGLPWASSIVGPGQLVFDWSVSVNILFRLFGDVRFSRSELKNSNYPPLPLRRAMCEVAAFLLIQSNWDPSMQVAAREGLALGRHQTEHAFATILGEKVSVAGLRDAFSSSGHDHAIRLEEYWNSKLVEQLRPFSYEF